MEKKFLTATFIFEAGSLNYGEGTGNYSELKKLTRGNGQMYTYISRQALRYDIVRLGAEMYGWDLNVVDKNQDVIQFSKEKTIKDSVEMDLFGYMKTQKNEAGVTRSAVVRLTHAISLEPYKGDLELLTNKGLADRIGENPNLANIENHLSFYSYTVSIDLDKVGVDGDIVLEKQQRLERVLQLLEILKVLNRKIRGRIENLAPVFSIGGVYPIPSPLFLGSLKLKTSLGKFYIDCKPLEEVLNAKFELIGDGYTPKHDTLVGIKRSLFDNEDEIAKLVEDSNHGDIYRFFELLKAKVREYYNSNGK
ncbi:type I-B CRISPR-associated protein Cas7/Cst2/DevR [Fervidobacterium islandicum]|uniref:Type I-B CRISPR-associated protein Cas7/Cst2/DevR n=1 Tax=Fervidobacterium islandicum TaxID=2423 RepID=A0AAI8CME3_FERIS|nr:type I-B CRISPR-associated protein Cas7/Cst2/DevR [Fervidobacterium islandicum]AMW33137.1 type I-B CRISPR-associated protein Cas7/Cst2/DevR [Fervidobacterium islandicum]